MSRQLHLLKRNVRAHDHEFTKEWTQMVNRKESPVGSNNPWVYVAAIRVGWLGDSFERLVVWQKLHLRVMSDGTV